MPTYSQSAGPAAANPDGVSLQSVGGVLAQKSQSLVGAVITSDFTTTSASLVDVTGMTITLGLTNNVATDVVVRAVASSSATQIVNFSLQSTATKEYVWIHWGNATTFTVTRNADMADNTLLTNADLVMLDGFLTGTTSGVVTKIQAAVAGGATLTVKVGSVLYGGF